MRLAHLPKISKREGSLIMTALKKSGFVDYLEQIKKEQQELVQKCQCRFDLEKCKDCRYNEDNFCRLKPAFDLNLI